MKEPYVKTANVNAADGLDADVSVNHPDLRILFHLGHVDSPKNRNKKLNADFNKALDRELKCEGGTARLHVFEVRTS